jgi:deoxyribodipyrimidine photolyase-related protein
MKAARTLRVILGDQLNLDHSWFRETSPGIEYLMMEVREEATYVRHHIQKIIAFFAAMRAFAAELKARGCVVRYVALDDPDNQPSLTEVVRGVAIAGQFGAVEYQSPDEYRVKAAFLDLEKTLEVPVRCVASEHFLVTPEFFREVFAGHKRYTMELFYRAVRRQYGFLMEDGEPIGERWNFDAANRHKLPAGTVPPPPLEFPRDVSELDELLTRCKVPSIGRVNPQRFTWPVTRADALRALEYFCAELLEHFGAYQDAMHTSHRFLYHSRLSFALNVKLLSPREVIEAAIEAWRGSGGRISIEQVEGFVRQIAGWREFVRGLYWAEMPRYRTLNVLGANRPLPHFFWDGDTRMNCVKHAVEQSLDEAYAHHIQRLMVTGNFAVLAGIDPDEVDRWYLGIYIDALEWVELPNTRGMSQFADGGIVGTKPYTSSAQYINKMSNYCAGCFYDYKEKFGERGCPFNTLYWDFLMRHREKIASNPRIGMGYRQIDKMTPANRRAITDRAAEILATLEKL